MEILNELMGNQNFFETANLTTEDSGLPYNVWLDSAGKDRNVEHNTPRLKVEVDNEFIPMSISKDDVWSLKDFKKKSVMVKWIMDNYDVLIRHWNKELTDRQALNLLSKD